MELRTCSSIPGLPIALFTVKKVFVLNKSLSVLKAFPCQNTPPFCHSSSTNFESDNEVITIRLLKGKANTSSAAPPQVHEGFPFLSNVVHDRAYVWTIFQHILLINLSSPVASDGYLFLTTPLRNV